MSIISTVSCLDHANPLEESSNSNTYAHLRQRVQRSEQRLADMQMPSFKYDDDLMDGLFSPSDPINVLCIKNQIIQAATNKLEDEKPDMPRTRAELEIMIEENLKKESEELVRLNNIKKKMLSSIQSQIEEANVGSQDLSEVYQGMLSSNQGSNQDEQDKNMLPSLRQMCLKLKDSLKLVLEILVPNEKQKMLEILSTLENAKKRNDGWVEIIKNDGNSDERESSSVHNNSSISEGDLTCMSDAGSIIRHSSSHRSKNPHQTSGPLPDLDPKASSYWGAIQVLLSCYVIEQNKEDPRLFRLWIR